jgi:hypothetical protein
LDHGLVRAAGPNFASIYNVTFIGAYDPGQFSKREQLFRHVTKALVIQYGDKSACPLL